MRGRQTSTTGPDFGDLATTVQYLRDNYRHHIEVMLSPPPANSEQWTVRIIATYAPTNATQALAAATKRPEGIVWEAQWSHKFTLELTSMLFRGLFEVEIALSELIEQMDLPV